MAVPLSVLGEPHVGVELTAAADVNSVRALTGNPDDTRVIARFSWHRSVVDVRDGATGPPSLEDASGWIPIAGASRPTYRCAEADMGRWIRVTVMPLLPGAGARGAPASATGASATDAASRPPLRAVTGPVSLPAPKRPEPLPMEQPQPLDPPQPSSRVVVVEGQYTAVAEGSSRLRVHLSPTHVVADSGARELLPQDLQAQQGTLSRGAEDHLGSAQGLIPGYTGGPYQPLNQSLAATGPTSAAPQLRSASPRQYHAPPETWPAFITDFPTASGLGTIQPPPQGQQPYSQQAVGNSASANRAPSPPRGSLPPTLLPAPEPQRQPAQRFPYDFLQPATDPSPPHSVYSQSHAQAREALRGLMQEAPPSGSSLSSGLVPPAPDTTRTRGSPLDPRPAAGPSDWQGHRRADNSPWGPVPVAGAYAGAQSRGTPSPGQQAPEPARAPVLEVPEEIEDFIQYAEEVVGAASDMWSGGRGGVGTGPGAAGGGVGSSSGHDRSAAALRHHAEQFQPSYPIGGLSNTLGATNVHLLGAGGSSGGGVGRANPVQLRPVGGLLPPDHGNTGGDRPLQQEEPSLRYMSSAPPPPPSGLSQPPFPSHRPQPTLTPEPGPPLPTQRTGGLGGSGRGGAGLRGASPPSPLPAQRLERAFQAIQLGSREDEPGPERATQEEGLQRRLSGWEGWLGGRAGGGGAGGPSSGGGSASTFGSATGSLREALEQLLAQHQEVIQQVGLELPPEAPGVRLPAAEAPPAASQELYPLPAAHPPTLTAGSSLRRGQQGDLGEHQEHRWGPLRTESAYHTDALDRSKDNSNGSEASSLSLSRPLGLAGRQSVNTAPASGGFFGGHEFLGLNTDGRRGAPHQPAPSAGSFMASSPPAGRIHDASQQQPPWGRRPRGREDSARPGAPGSEEEHLITQALQLARMDADATLGSRGSRLSPGNGAAASDQGRQSVVGLAAGAPDDSPAARASSVSSPGRARASPSRPAASEPGARPAASAQPAAAQLPPLNDSTTSSGSSADKGHGGRSLSAAAAPHDASATAAAAAAAAAAAGPWAAPTSSTTSSSSSSLRDMRAMNEALIRQLADSTRLQLKMQKALDAAMEQLLAYQTKDQQPRRLADRQTSPIQPPPSSPSASQRSRSAERGPDLRATVSPAGSVAAPTAAAGQQPYSTVTRGSSPPPSGWLRSPQSAAAQTSDSPRRQTSQPVAARTSPVRASSPREAASSGAHITSRSLDAARSGGGGAAAIPPIAAAARLPDARSQRSWSSPVRGSGGAVARQTQDEASLLLQQAAALRRSLGGKDHGTGAATASGAASGAVRSPRSAARSEEGVHTSGLNPFTAAHVAATEAAASVSAARSSPRRAAVGMPDDTGAAVTTSGHVGTGTGMESRPRVGPGEADLAVGGGGGDAAALREALQQHHMRWRAKKSKLKEQAQAWQYTAWRYATAWKKTRAMLQAMMEAQNADGAVEPARKPSRSRGSQPPPAGAAPPAASVHQPAPEQDRGVYPGAPPPPSDQRAGQATGEPLELRRLSAPGVVAGITAALKRREPGRQQELQQLVPDYATSRHPDFEGPGPAAYSTGYTRLEDLRSDRALLRDVRASPLKARPARPHRKRPVVPTAGAAAAAADSTGDPRDGLAPLVSRPSVKAGYGREESYGLATGHNSDVGPDSSRLRDQGHAGRSRSAGRGRDGHDTAAGVTEPIEVAAHWPATLRSGADSARSRSPSPTLARPPWRTAGTSGCSPQRPKPPRTRPDTIIAGQAEPPEPAWQCGPSDAQQQLRPPPISYRDPEGWWNYPEGWLDIYQQRAPHVLVQIQQGAAARAQQRHHHRYKPDGTAGRVPSEA